MSFDQTLTDLRPDRRSAARPYLTIFLCIACFALSLLAKYSLTNDLPVDVEYGTFPDAFDIWGGAWWGLLTSAFVHLEVLHLVFNVYWLWYLGRRLELAIGPLYYLLLLVASALVSSSAQLAVSGQTGIGMSGVVYALFGFMWVARNWYPQFRAAVPQQVVNIMLIWLAFCVAMSYAGKWNVGNAAHIAGILFGISVAGSFWPREARRAFNLRAVAVVAAALISAIAVTPLFWCPWQAGWTMNEGFRAHDREDYAAAIRWYQRSMDLGFADTSLAWKNIVIAYANMDDEDGYEHALEIFKAIDAQGAAELEAELLSSDEADSGDAASEDEMAATDPGAMDGDADDDDDGSAETDDGESRIVQLLSDYL